MTAPAGFPAALSGPRPWHWGVGLAAALLLHIASLIAFPGDRPRAPSPVLDGLLVSLGNTGTSPMECPQDGSEDPAVPEADQGQAEAPDLPPGSGTVSEAAPAPAEPAPAPAEPAPDLNPLSAIKPLRKPAPPQAEVAESPVPEMPVTSPPLEALPVARTPDSRHDLKQAAPETSPQDPATASLPAYVSRRLGAIGGGPVWVKGEPPKDAGMVPWGSDYWERLLTWLKKHGRYPRRAIPKRLEGEALLEFVIDRSGKVVTYRLLQSSGHFILDHEVKRMIKFADPVPALPAGFPDPNMHVILPVIFEILT